MKMRLQGLMLALALVPVTGAMAQADDIPDHYPASVLCSPPVEVAPGVYSAIGATQPPTYENAGHNNNLTFIVTSDGVAVVNGGASWKLADALHEEIRKITDQPVGLVINENGQGHSMLGNSYWASLDVPILAHEEAAAEFADHGPQGPGHGSATDLATVRHGTVDYLKDLRARIAEHIGNGGDLSGAYYVDQTKWAYMDTFEELATKNAGVVFAEMEFE